MKYLTITGAIILILLIYFAYKDVKKQEQIIHSELLTKYALKHNSELIARVLHAEGNGTPDIDKIAIGSSILNRMNNVEFPSSIIDVIYQKNQYVISDTFTQHDLQIASCLLEDHLRECDILYFFNPKTATNKRDIKKIRKRKLIIKTLGHEYY